MVQVKPVILMRHSLAEEEEYLAAQKYFPVHSTRASLPEDSLVIGRYSVLPYYGELCDDLACLNSALINSYHNHVYVADLGSWYEDVYYSSLNPATPKTWFNLESVPRDGGPFILKGVTNSKKQQWKTHMYAENWEEASKVHSRLLQDGLICSQDIVIREYVPLRSFGTAISGMPITEEYRFFYYKTTQLCGAYYWSEHFDVVEDYNLAPDNVPKEWLADIVSIVSQNIPFFVIDVARTKKGDWIVIELNDGQMSGLSMNDPDTLYKNLKEALCQTQ